MSATSTPLYEPERFRSPEYLAVIDQQATDALFQIPSHCLSIMREAGEAGYPHEICGLLVGTINNHGWQVHDIKPVANLNEERAADRFQLDPAGYQQIDRELRGTGLEIIGVYHSHPDCPAKPSPTDLGSAWEGFAYPIISICDGLMTDIQCWAVNTSASAFQNIEIKEQTI
ncbi:M67 family metallopeptidase [Mariprofundus sp. EBB-1]|uniref:M67 family metallopeptidase n=1 Tax=Mariprofundus sp. EBB-1 TaxID=2650971 RepID=UPI001F2E5E70|nr:M67 family metallopeptidase [Mariprofundus sp. EBB-1]